MQSISLRRHIHPKGYPWLLPALPGGLRVWQKRGMRTLAALCCGWGGSATPVASGQWYFDISWVIFDIPWVILMYIGLFWYTLGYFHSNLGYFDIPWLILVVPWVILIVTLIIFTYLGLFWCILGYFGFVLESLSGCVALLLLWGAFCVTNSNKGLKITEWYETLACCNEELS